MRVCVVCVCHKVLLTLSRISFVAYVYGNMGASATSYSPPPSSLSLPLFLSFSLLGIQAYKARGARSVYLQSIVGTLPPAIARFFLPLFFLITPIAVCVSFRPPPLSLSLSLFFAHLIQRVCTYLSHDL